MDSVSFYAGKLYFIQPMMMVKNTIHHYWVNLCGPLFWIASAVFILWNLDIQPEDETEKSEPPWQPPKIQHSPLVIPRISVKEGKKSNKKPFKTLKDQIVSWKQKKEDSGPKKNARIPFLRRFSTSEASLEQQKKKNFCSALTKTEAIQKLKLLGSKLKRTH
ncbi:unnamed protein product [Rhizopus stolonifer]